MPRKIRPIKAVRSRDVVREEIKSEGARGVGMRILAGPADGAKNFVMRKFSVRKGGHTPYHVHPWEHEVYVLSGKGVVRGERRKYPVSRGSALFIPGGRKHQFVNTGTGSLDFICVIPAMKKRKGK
jgi:quercetin dioxygenase-like cupin family protein